jgi:flagellar hook-associated protein 2
VGLSLDASGKLVLKEAKLVEQLDARFDEVVSMFTASRDNKSEYGGVDAGMAGEAIRSLTRMIKTGGLIDAQSTIADNQLQTQQDNLASLQERMQRVLDRYIRQFTTMDSIVGGSNSTRSGLTSTFDAMNAQND